MKKTMYKCDCCDRLVDYNHIIHMKAKSGSFVIYANQDMAFADKKNLDICTDCFYHIGLCSKKIVDKDGNSIKKEAPKTYRLTNAFEEGSSNVNALDSYMPNPRNSKDIDPNSLKLVRGEDGVTRLNFSSFNGLKYSTVLMRD